MNIPPPVTKMYFTPVIRTRQGCPSLPTPIYQTSTLPDGDRVKLIHNYTTMKLLHKSKLGQLKNSLSLDSIHHELEQAALVLHNSGSSNILLTKLSFDCLITNNSGEQCREYINFDLKIPGTGTERESVFSYDMIEKIYGSKASLYGTLRYFYNLGRSLGNPADHKHGHKPDYNPNDSKHDQYIRHTEQLLVAYLALPQASEMIRNRLRTTIRGKYPDSSAVKVYNTGIHMHSTKTCCGPCEYALIGLMNDRSNRGFLHNFKQACLTENDVLKFELPKRSLFRLLVTVTANQPDAHHKAQPQYTAVQLGPRASPLPFIIDVKENSTSSKIFSTLLGNSYDRRDLPSSITLSDKTVGISGSKATPGSSSTIGRVSTHRDSELDEYTGALALLKLS